MLYRPSNASISLASFSGNLAEVYKNKFELRIIQPSVFELVVSNESLHLVCNLQNAFTSFSYHNKF